MHLVLTKKCMMKMDRNKERKNDRCFIPGYLKDSECGRPSVKEDTENCFVTGDIKPLFIMIIVLFNC